MVESRLETIVECVDLDAMLQFFTDDVGCRLESVTPADAPRDYVVGLGDTRLRLRRSEHDVAGRLCLSGPESAAGDTLVAPNGTIVEFAAPVGHIDVPDSRPSLSTSRAADAGEFGAGRAGMAYRDLLPDRWGGRFIASHIRIADGGDVADYVHFHRIRFQMIFVAAGWVEVVYEDQGPPFRMEAGDCVLQPPEIRHRVLRSSPGLEVIEIGCPAEHDTLVEHDITLPTSVVRSDREFGGQRFVRHIAATAATEQADTPGFSARDTGIGAATAGLADAQVLTADATPDFGSVSTSMRYDGEFAMYVVVHGQVTATVTVDAGGAERTERLGPRDSITIPPGAVWCWSERSEDLEMLQVTLPTGCIEPVDMNDIDQDRSS